VQVLLVATYELGHQPGNLARPAAALRARGHAVRTLDVSIDAWRPELEQWADVVAFSVPMHTASRLARELAAGTEKPTCCYGLYAHQCGDVADRVISGEYEDALVAWVEQPTAGRSVELGQPGTPAPIAPAARDLLPSLDRYAQLDEGGARRLVGSVETTRGCAHRCRHCPVPVVYDGRVRVQDEQAVLDDIARLAAAGASSCDTLGRARCDALGSPYRASSSSVRARRFSVELKS
jgi:hypothetical protein